MTVRRIPPATMARLLIYLQGLMGLAREGVPLASSHGLASAAGVEAPRIRRDLSYPGAFGTPDVGYEVDGLLDGISICLGLSRVCPVALVSHADFPERHFRAAAIFDANPDLVESRVGDLEVMPLARLAAVVGEQGKERL